MRVRGSGTIPLSAGYSLSEDDTYLVVPDDVGDEIVDMLRDADHALLEEALDESLLVFGDVRRGPGGRADVAAEFAVSVSQAFRDGLPYAASLELSADPAWLRRLNQLSHVQCTMVSALLDGEGLQAVLDNPRYAGISWRSPADAPNLASLAPTYVMSRRRGGRVGLELALFVEDEDLVALVRPAEVLAAPAA